MGTEAWEKVKLLFLSLTGKLQPPLEMPSPPKSVISLVSYSLKAYVIEGDEKCPIY